MFTSALSLIGSLLTNRLGQIALVAMAVWAWTAHNTASHWRDIIAKEKAAVEAAYKAEVARQAVAAEEIAAAATARAETDASVVADMKNIIVEYERKLKERPHVTAQKSDCLVDHNFVGVVRQLSNSGSRKATVTSRPSRVRAPR